MIIFGISILEILIHIDIYIIVHVMIFMFNKYNIHDSNQSHNCMHNVLLNLIYIIILGLKILELLVCNGILGY